MTLINEFNISTGETTQREMTSKEAAAYEMSQQAAVVVPQSVTRRQIKLALLQSDLLGDVEAAIAASNDRALQINWEDALDFQRDNPLVLAMAAQLGKMPEEIDDLFLSAAAL